MDTLFLTIIALTLVAILSKGVGRALEDYAHQCERPRRR